MKKIYLKPVAESISFYSEEAIAEGGLDNLDDINSNGELSINFFELSIMDNDWS